MRCLRPARGGAAFCSATTLPGVQVCGSGSGLSENPEHMSPSATDPPLPSFRIFRALPHLRRSRKLVNTRQIIYTGLQPSGVMSVKRGMSVKVIDFLLVEPPFITI
jgi:hypothetical protein